MDYKTFAMVQMTGKYKRTSEENYGKFLDKLNVGMMMKAGAMVSTPTMDISEADGKWKIVTATTLKNVTIEFELVRFNV